MKQIRLFEKWGTSHDLFELLIGEIAKDLQQHKPNEVGFTISRPNEPHQLISNLLQIMDCIDPQQHTLDVISPIFPTCLYLLTLGNSCLLPIYWLRKKKHKIDLVVEIWHETHELLKATEDSMDLVYSQSYWPPGCGARKAYRKAFQEVKKYSVQPIPFNPYDLFENMLHIVPTILSEYLHNRQEESSCDHCNIVFFNDTKIMRKAEKFISMPKSLKSLLVNSCRYYKDWLLNRSIEQIDYYLEKDFDNRLPIQRVRLNPDAIKAKRAQVPWLEIVQDE
jgi:hypothetical protein